MYLGLPLGGHPKKTAFWQPVIDEVQGKLDKWRRYNLSRGGRVTLCKSVLSNLPNYYMSTFLIPKKVAVTLERTIRNFFWEGRKGGKLNHLVKWEQTIEGYQDGGLGYGCLKTRNLALLAKWGWRYLKGEPSLWQQVIMSIHGGNIFNWHTTGKEGVSLKALG